MRRKDREIVDDIEIRDILEKAQICRIALCDGDQPYIVPLNFGVEWGTPLKFYFHCANEGHKLDLIRRNNKVCFQVDVDNELIMGDLACSCSLNYRSVIAFGRISIVTNQEEKIKGLDILMSQYSDAKSFVYDDNTLKRTTVLEMTVEEITGKKKSVKPA